MKMPLEAEVENGRGHADTRNLHKQRINWDTNSTQCKQRDEDIS